MGKTDWEIREELRKKDPHFRKLWDVYEVMDERSREFDLIQGSRLIFKERRRQKERCVLMPKLKDTMYNIILQYRKDNPE